MVDSSPNNHIHPPMKYVEKGWGYEKWIVNKEEYCGKLLFFKEGKQCSWHYHKKKDEVFYLQSGKMIVRYSEGDNFRAGTKLLCLYRATPPNVCS